MADCFIKTVKCNNNNSDNIYTYTYIHTHSHCYKKNTQQKYRKKYKNFRLNLRVCRIKMGGQKFYIFLSYNIFTHSYTYVSICIYVCIYLYIIFIYSCILWVTFYFLLFLSFSVIICSLFLGKSLNLIQYGISAMCRSFRWIKLLCVFFFLKRRV